MSVFCISPRWTGRENDLLERSRQPSGARSDLQSIASPAPRRNGTTNLYVCRFEGRMRCGVDMTRAPELSVVHRTAVQVAAIRGAHLVQDGEPKIMRDEYALALGGWSEEQAVAMADRAREVMSTRYTIFVCRGRFAEDRLARAR